MKTRVVVTGGAGFIGSHVVKLLLSKNYEVVIIDDLSSGYASLVQKGVTFYHASLAQSDVVMQALKGTKFVIHLAAISYIEATIQDPLGCFENNVINGVHLLNAMRKMHVPTIIFSSTAAVYGSQIKMPILESVPKYPLQPYGASKLAFEHVLSAYASCYGLNAIALRFFNAYGPADEQSPQTRAVPLWCRLVAINQPVELFWRGRQIRDYVYVEDIARAHVMVKDLKGFNVFNIGHGQGVVMHELLDMIYKTAGKKEMIGYGGKRLGDPEKLVADIHKIKQVVGWQPQVTLADGIARTYDYYATHLKPLSV